MYIHSLSLLDDHEEPHFTARFASLARRESSSSEVLYKPSGPKRNMHVMSTSLQKAAEARARICFTTI
jgi:hypothetical protein